MKLHVNLNISFSTETINKATSWHPFDLAFKIAPDNSKRPCHFLYRGSFNGFHSRLPRGVRTRLEGKQRTPLSSQVATRISWSPLSGLKGVEPPLQFGERTRDCSPGQAGKEGPQLAMTGASHGFPQAAAPMGVFSRGTMRTSGSLSCSAREVRSPCTWRGGAGHHSRVMGSG